MLEVWTMARRILSVYSLISALGHSALGSFVGQSIHSRNSLTNIQSFRKLRMSNNRSTYDETKLISRTNFIQSEMKSSILSSLLIQIFLQTKVTCNAFDGGVGGLGKSKPDTGVVFANSDLPLTTTGGGGTAITTELLSPDRKTTALVSFYAPWPLLRSTNGIESRDLSNPEATFLRVAPAVSIPDGSNINMDVSNIPASYFDQFIFGISGKFGMYGPVTDLKVKKVIDKQASSIYLASFTTLTPAMRESERKAYISVSIVGNGVFMLITSSTASRFKAQDTVLRRIADSFSCVEAPKSNFRR